MIWKMMCNYSRTMIDVYVQEIYRYDAYKYKWVRKSSLENE